MKKIILLLSLIFVFASCKTGTLLVVPFPNVEIPIYPPQSSLITNINNVYKSQNTYYYNTLGMGFLNKNNMVLFSDNLFLNYTNRNLLKNNFVYLK